MSVNDLDLQITSKIDEIKQEMNEKITQLTGRTRSFYFKYYNPAETCKWIGPD